MAKQLDYDGQGSGATNAISPTFYPKASFFLMAIGDLKANITFTVQWLPTNLPDNTSNWPNASGTQVTLSGTTKVATINGAAGFMYRVQRSGTGDQNEDVNFYWGEVTTIDVFKA